MNILSLIWLIFLPFIIAIIIMLPVFPNNKVIVRRFAKWFAGFHFIYALLFLNFFDSATFGMSFEKELTFLGISWLKSLGISAKFAVDGISLLFVILTTFIVLISLVLSKIHVRAKHKLYYSMVFLFETAVLGVFCAKDMFMFFVFWELLLIPLYFLISQWGNAFAKSSAIKFIIISFCTNIILFFGMLIIYYYNFAISNVLTANIQSLNIEDTIYPLWFQVMIFVSFLVGFVTKIPLVLFHNWYPDIQSKVVAPVSILISGILLNTGVYGLIRFNMQVFPEIFKLFAPVLMILGVVNLIYAGCLAILQKEVKKMVSYLHISTMGLIMLGLSSLNAEGFNGSILMSVACSILYPALFCIIAAIQFRTKNVYISALGGLGQVMPKCMYLALIICFAGIGTPFLIMFAPKLLVLSGAMLSNLEQQLLVKVAAIIGLGSMIISAGCLFYFFYKLFCSVLLPQWQKVKDISAHEASVLCSLCLIIFYLGINPMSIIQIYNSVSNIILDIIQV